MADTPEPKIKETHWTKELEESVVSTLAKQTFSFSSKAKKPFIIDTPPPYPSGTWHIGATAAYALIDIIARSRRMLGYNVLFPWGVDRNGINIELVVEKKYKKRMREWPRDEFNALCKKEIDLIAADLEKIARRVGLSCDFENKYETDSPEYRAASQAAFIKLWHDGNVVEDLRPNNYCVDCGTTIADAEVYYEEKDAMLVHVRWRTEDGKEIVIATTRPELLCACRIVLVNPDDDRYKSLHGKRITVPLYGRTVEIKPHSYVDPTYGTGVMMICSYGDSGDVKLFRELALTPVAAIGTNARMTEAAGPYTNLKIKEARQKIVEDLKAAGLVVKEEPVKHKVPICERSKTTIEIINLKEWYVKQTHVLGALKKHAKAMKFHPEKHRQLLLDWMDNVSIDWPVSRRRYYHTEIPVWYCAKCNHAMVPEPGPYYQPWKQKAPFKKCSKCASTEFVGEEKVFDTWMDSSISNLYIIGYPKKFQKKLFPTSLRPQGRDIVRTWLYYTALKSHLLLGERPFEHVWITGMGLDQHGRKMSKSLGNIIHPDEVINKYGADAFRFWIAGETKVGDDFRISTDRIEGAQKFLTKLYNVARFISAFEIVDKPKKLRPVDEWVLSEFDAAHKRAMDGYEEFDFFEPANAMKNFIWNVYAPHYLEMVKTRAYAGDKTALWTLTEILRRTLLLLAPITPFVSYKIYKDVWGKNVHELELPDKFGVADKTTYTQAITEFNSNVWKAKKEKNIGLGKEISGIEVSKLLEPFADELKAMHKLV